MRQNSSSLDHDIQKHYGSQNIGDAILSALAAAGVDLDQLKPEDLAPIEELHIRGRAATVELAQQLQLDPGKLVLDLGSGLGGASRYLALEYGCRVTGLDLTEAYCRAARAFANLLGLSSLLTYRHGNALEMPFEDAAFDVIWTQHTAMNIADKARLYTEIRRVLRPGGLFAMYDILAGPGGPIYFPVPWASEPSLSYLITPEALGELLEHMGFQIVNWQDTSAAGRAWFREQTGKTQAQSGSPPLRVSMVFGGNVQAMGQNVIRNLNEDRMVLIEAIARLPAA